MGLETTLKRPIINTRDEPHGDPSAYRRLHVIIGDANLSEYQIFLKLGTTALMLAALEDGAIPDPLDLLDPVESCWQVSHDLDPGQAARTRRRRNGDGARAPGPLSGVVRASTSRRNLDDPVWNLVIEEWETDPRGFWRPTRTSWPTPSIGWPSAGCSRATSTATACQWTNSKLRALDLQYHDVDPEKGLYYRLAARGSMRRLFTDERDRRRRIQPPDPDPGLLPGPVRHRVPRFAGRRQLGFAGVRHRRSASQAGSYDGTTAW